MKRVTASEVCGIALALGLDQRDQRQVRGPLRDRLERLALVIDARRDPEAVDRIGQEQHLDATRPKALQLGRGLQPREIGAGHVVDRGLVLPQRARHSP